jgi:hypothetical protein
LLLANDFNKIIETSWAPEKPISPAASYALENGGSATIGAGGRGQGGFDSESKEAPEFAENLLNDCMAYAKEQSQVMKAEAEEKQQEVEQRILKAECAKEESDNMFDQLQAQILHGHDLTMRSVCDHAEVKPQAECPRPAQQAPAAQQHGQAQGTASEPQRPLHQHQPSPSKMRRSGAS